MQPEAIAEIRVRARLARNYAAYYGHGALERLCTYDVVILQQSAFTSSNIRQLLTAGTIPLAYLSLSEDNAQHPAPPPWQQLDAAGQVMLNPDWGSRLVDPTHPDWREYVLQNARAARALGFAGLMLDTLDAPDQAGVAQLVIALRLHWPDAVIIMNRGFALLQHVIWHVDGVIFESLSTTWFMDAQGGIGYSQVEKLEYEENQRLAQAVSAYIAPLGLARWALDYASAALVNASELGAFAHSSAAALGYVSFVTDRALLEL